MPDGRTHDRITWVLALPVLLATWKLGASVHETMALGAAFVFAGLMFSGDLDLPSVQYRRWGPLRWLWKPYQWLIPHRSSLSHGIVIGPAVRLIYLSVVVAGLAAVGLALAHSYAGAPDPGRLLASELPSGPVGPTARAEIGYALAGLWLGGASHTIADRLGSAWKRLFRRKRR